MEHIDFILWLVLKPVLESITLKYIIKNRKDLGFEQPKENVYNAYQWISLMFYIAIAVLVY
jgi:hypothetical protein